MLILSQLDPVFNDLSMDVLKYANGIDFEDTLVAFVEFV